MASKKNKGDSPFWRIFISLVCLSGLIYMSSGVALHFFGVKDMAILDGASQRIEDSKEYQGLTTRITVSYHFYVEGKKYKNSISYNSGNRLATVVGREDETKFVAIRYLGICPYFNSLDKLVAFEEPFTFVYRIAAILFLSWFILFINGVRLRKD